MKINNRIILFFIISLIFISCNKSDKDLNIVKFEQSIEKIRVNDMFIADTSHFKYRISYTNEYTCTYVFSKPFHGIASILLYYCVTVNNTNNKVISIRSYYK